MNDFAKCFLAVNFMLNGHDAMEVFDDDDDAKRILGASVLKKFKTYNNKCLKDSRDPIAAIKSGYAKHDCILPATLDLDFFKVLYNFIRGGQYTTAIVNDGSAYNLESLMYQVRYNDFSVDTLFNVTASLIPNATDCKDGEEPCIIDGVVHKPAGINNQLLTGYLYALLRSMCYGPLSGIFDDEEKNRELMDKSLGERYFFLDSVAHARFSAKTYLSDFIKSMENLDFPAVYLNDLYYRVPDMKPYYDATGVACQLTGANLDSLAIMLDSKRPNEDTKPEDFHVEYINLMDLGSFIQHDSKDLSKLYYEYSGSTGTRGNICIRM